MLCSQQPQNCCAQRRPRPAPPLQLALVNVSMEGTFLLGHSGLLVIFISSSLIVGAVGAYVSIQSDSLCHLLPFTSHFGTSTFLVILGFFLFCCFVLFKDWLIFIG